MANRSKTLGALFGIVMLTVAGCAPGSVSGEGDRPTPRATTGAPTETAPPGEPVFRMPPACADILPASSLDGFETEGLSLLGGPEGLFGDDYLADPTPEQRAGGITCIWGDRETTVSSVTISVAPLTASSRPGVVSSLSGQGLNANVNGPIATFAILGDGDHRPAILNVLRDDSWISVIMTIGGTEPFERALDLADEVATMIYVTP